jgi:uncharacterized membrane protein
MSTIVGLFDYYRNAEYAVQNLQNYGVESDRICIVERDRDAIEQGTAAEIGALTGAATGGLVGLLTGLSTVVPGIGLVVVTGTLASALATALEMAVVGAGFGAATGGLLGALIDSGFSNEDAVMYAEGLKHGRIAVLVETDSQKDDDQGEIKHILRTSGAKDINAPQETWEDDGWTSFEETERSYADAFSHT